MKAIPGRHRRWLALGLFLVAGTFRAGVSRGAEEVVLVEDGRTTWRIVLSGGTDGSTAAAAYDLAELLKDMTGAVFHVVTDADGRPKDQPEIILGGVNKGVQCARENPNPVPGSPRREPLAQFEL